jgi:hypothetical protein
MIRCIFINPFQDEKDLNGLPKIALRKSGAETLRISPNPSLRKRDLPPRRAIRPFVKED